MNTTTARTTAQFLAEIIGNTPFDVWNGVAGYDTRPYVKAGTVASFDRHTALPVAFQEGYAANTQSDWGGFRDAGDTEAFVTGLPVGAVIVVPDYHGCNYEGEESYILAPNGWLHHDSYSAHADAA